MFGWISTTVPSGLALYWAVSNAAGITMQYFYAGRRLDWRNLLSFGPPQPQAPVKGAKKQQASEDEPARTKQREPAPENGATDEASAEPVVRDRPAESRRKRHGRRRGKR
jgi:hypothetical protein